MMYSLNQIMLDNAIEHFVENMMQARQYIQVTEAWNICLVLLLPVELLRFKGCLKWMPSFAAMD